MFNNVKVSYGKENVSTNNIYYSSNNVQELPKEENPYHLTGHQFFDILALCYEQSYGEDYSYHPEDLYVNASLTLEIVSNTLANLLHIKTGQQIRGVKE